jgi:DNA-directed RNA polymerase specialized sigma24 family protein
MPSHPETEISLKVSTTLLGEAQRSASVSNIPVGQFLKELIEVEIATRRLQTLPPPDMHVWHAPRPLTGTTNRRTGRAPNPDNPHKISVIAAMKLDDAPTRAIAAALGVTAGAVKVFLHRHREPIEEEQHRLRTAAGGLHLPRRG